MKAIHIFLIFFSFVLCARSTPESGDNGDSGESEGMPVFYIEYIVVQENAFGNKGNFDELMKLSKLAPKKAEFIAKFWRTRALAEMDDHIQKAIQRVIKKSRDPASKATQQEAMKETNYFLYSYYYDNWESINKMILASFEEASRQ